MRRTRRGEYELRLTPTERDALRGLPAQLRDLVRSENPASDEAVARLFPPAYTDDPIANLEYERLATDRLLAGRLRAIDTMERTIEAERLSEEEALAWLAVINDLRLVLGTRLGVTEETREEDFPASDPRRGAYALYAYLTWFEDAAIGALSSGSRP